MLLLILLWNAQEKIHPLSCADDAGTQSKTEGTGAPAPEAPNGASKSATPTSIFIQA